MKGFCGVVATLTLASALVLISPPISNAQVHWAKMWNVPHELVPGTDIIYIDWNWDGAREPYWIARYVRETSLPEVFAVEPQWADSRQCPALSKVVRQIEKLKAPRPGADPKPRAPPIWALPTGIAVVTSYGGYDNGVLSVETRGDDTPVSRIVWPAFEALKPCLKPGDPPDYDPSDLKPWP